MQFSGHAQMRGIVAFKSHLYGLEFKETSLVRAGMMASRLNRRERVIPAQTDHLEDKGGVIGPQSSHERTDSAITAPNPLPPLA